MLSGVGERDHFVLFAARSKVLPDFLERSPESLSRGQRAESQHRIVSLVDSSVISLNPTAHVCAAPMLHLRTKNGPDRTRIGIVAVGGDRFGAEFTMDCALRRNRWAAPMSRVALSIESTRLPSRSMARYR